MATYDKTRNLPCYVILQAVKDYVRTYRIGDKNGMRRECYDFLTGKTDMALMWFDMAGMKPFSRIGYDGLYFKVKCLDELMWYWSNGRDNKREAV